MKSRRLILPVFAILAGQSLSAQPVGHLPWPERPDFTAVGSGAEAISRFPNSLAMIRLAIGQALAAKDRAQVKVLVLRLLEMGGSLSEASRAAVLDVFDDIDRPSIAARLAANAEPKVASRIASTISNSVQLVESVAVHPDTGEVFVSSVASGGLYRLGADDTVIKLSLAQESHFGLAGDWRHGILWAGIAVVDASPADNSGFAGIVGYDLVSGFETARIPVESAGASPGDILVQSNGSVLVSDSATGAIYRCAFPCVKLETLVPPGVLRSPQGLAEIGDMKTVFVADYNYGLARIGPNGQVFQVNAPATVMLDGIDGVFEHSGSLIAIQNGTNPQRIVQFEIDKDSLDVASVRVLEQSVPDWMEPTSGQIVRDQLIYVSNSQWPLFAEQRSKATAVKTSPTLLRALNLPAVQ